MPVKSTVNAQKKEWKGEIMKLFEKVKKKIYNSKLVKRQFSKYCNDSFAEQSIPSETNILSICDYLNKILLYEKARTLLQDNVFTIQFEDTYIKFYLPNATNDVVQTGIFDSEKFFEQDLLVKMAKYITPESVVLDAGTNIGNHTLFFAKILNAKKVYCFEPMKTIFAILEKNLELNNITNVEKYNFALGEKEGYAKISGYHSISLGSTQFSFEDKGDFKVVALDSFNIDQLDFCKVDVEGCQLEFLKGAKNTLEKFKPVIWIEMLSKEHSAFNYNEDREITLPHNFLESLGYELAEKMSGYDYLYIHKTKLNTTCSPTLCLQVKD